MTRWLLSLTIALLLVSPAAAIQEYGFSISASSTDPEQNTAPPTPGVFSLYLWYHCGDRALSELHFETTGTLTFVAWQSSGVIIGPCLGGLYSGCPTAPFLTGVFTVLDPAGLGGTLCLTGCLGSQFPMAVDCDDQPYDGAFVGFASDGTTPCALGQCGTVAVERDGWGGVKALYR